MPARQPDNYNWKGHSITTLRAHISRGDCHPDNLVACQKAIDELVDEELRSKSLKEGKYRPSLGTDGKRKFHPQHDWRQYNKATLMSWYKHPECHPDDKPKISEAVAWHKSKIDAMLVQEQQEAARVAQMKLEKAHQESLRVQAKALVIPTGKQFKPGGHMLGLSTIN